MTVGAEKPEAASDAGQSGGYPLSLVLAALAGAVDAVGYVHWHGLFVSFMSGNSTIFGAAAASADWHAAIISLCVIGGFVAGVVAGEMLAGVTGTRARPAVLLVEAVLLGGGAIAAVFGARELVAAPILSLAMGIQNASVHRAGGISVALTYVTGTLVHVGRGLAKALHGTGRWFAVLPFLGLWCALVIGATVGASVAVRSEDLALAGAAGLALLLAITVSVTADSRARAGSGSSERLNNQSA